MKVPLVIYFLLTHARITFRWSEFGRINERVRGKGSFFVPSEFRSRGTFFWLMKVLAVDEFPARLLLVADSRCCSREDRNKGRRVRRGEKELPVRAARETR